MRLQVTTLEAEELERNGVVQSRPDGRFSTLVTSTGATLSVRVEVSDDHSRRVGPSRGSAPAGFGSDPSTWSWATPR
jgi:hypothetical protein